MKVVRQLLDLLSDLPFWAYPLIPLGLFLVDFIVRGIYNLYFHPLHKFPGPRLAAFTSLYESWYIFMGNEPMKMRELHEKYGPIVRRGPNDLSFNSASSWKDIYSHVGSRPTFIKAPEVYTDGGRTSDIVRERDTVRHGQMRKMLSHAFSAKTLAEQEDIVQKYIDIFIKYIGKSASGPDGDEMVKWYNCLTFDIIGDLSFGEPFGGLKEGGQPHGWVTGILDAIYAQEVSRAFRNFFGTTGIGKTLSVMSVPKKLQEKDDQQDRYSLDRVKRRMDNPGARKDFMSHILESKDARSTSLAEMAAQATLLITAGSETTATFLSAVTFFLSTDPVRYRKLTDEIRNAFASYNDITNSATQRLAYLKAVIDEGLRMYPPVPIGLPRISPGETVDGVYIPAGARLSTSSWAATHNPENFHRPDDFMPERWLDPDCTDKKHASQPFSLGSRVCLGRNLAEMEMRLILVKLLWTYDMELLNRNLRWIPDSKANLLWRKPPLIMRLTRRPGIDAPVL